MAGSDEGPAAIENSEAPADSQWRRVSGYYRRPLGLGWLIALVVIPLLLGAFGYAFQGLQDRSQSWSTGPTGKLPTLAQPAPSSPQPPAPRVPAITLAPASIVRSGNDITLSGDFPDQKARAALVDAASGSLPPGVNVIDRLGINPDVNALDFTDAAKVFSAAAPVADFKLTVKGDTVTLAGTTATADQQNAVEQAAQDTWPNVNILDKIEINGPISPTQSPAPTAPPPPPGPSGQSGDCGNLQQAISRVLPTPITFGVNASTLTPEVEQQLSSVADKVKACPSAHVTINGYSDNTGNDAINVALSAQRADVVADFLTSKGVTRDHLTSKGLGSNNPVGSNETPEGRAQNRRVEIVVG